MRTTEYAYGWEVEGLERRLRALEERLDRRDRARSERQQKRLECVMLAFWILWAAAIGAIVTTAALS
jgi:hypothetical protein